MNVNALLTEDAPARSGAFYPPASTSTPHTNGSAMTPKSLSPKAGCKNVVFRLRDSHTGPKTFQIRHHDNTDSIIDTVKHLLGVSRQDLGVSLEDVDGVSFIPSYENFADGMTVFVRIEESLAHDLVRRHSYNLRQTQQALQNALGNRTYGYPNSRSVSPNSRGRRSTSATGRQRSLKRAQPHDLDDDHYQDRYVDGQWGYTLPHQQLLPDEEEEPRTKAGSVASAEISVENILEGSRRKRPKFSSDELPLFPPTLPRQNGSVSSLSPSRPNAQMATPYSQRNFSFSHPTPQSNVGDYIHARSHSVHITNGIANGVVPTPAPTVTSCISDEDVAIQLMRLGNANSGANSASTAHDNREGFISDCGEYGDEDGARSDTTELPEPLPPATQPARYHLPDSPILYPGGHQRKYKSLDEILPSFDTTEPSDEENQPPGDNVYPTGHISGPHRQGVAASDDDAQGDDEADETYAAKEEDENDADYEDDLDDIPLKMRREKIPAAPHNSSSRPHQPHPRGLAKVVRKHPVPKPTMIKTHDGQYPISPASPPLSRKQSIASSSSHKARPMNVAPLSHNHFGTPMSQDASLVLTGGDEQGQFEEPQRPRCQRCRKSKKGCDRQRPCQRCKDAGIPADQCISEDEAGTRRGRQAAAAAKRAGMAANGLPKSKKKKKV